MQHTRSLYAIWFSHVSGTMAIRQDALIRIDEAANFIRPANMPYPGEIR